MSITDKITAEHCYTTSDGRRFDTMHVALKHQAKLEFVGWYNADSRVDGAQFRVSADDVLRDSYGHWIAPAGRLADWVVANRYAVRELLDVHGGEA